MNKQGIVKAVNKLGRMVTGNSPTILTGLSVAGLVGTVVLAVKATPKAIQILEDEKYDMEPCGVELTTKDVIRLTWKCYVPAMVMGGVTIACMVGANSINLRRNAALASVYSLTEASLKEYKAKVVQTIGEAKEEKIRQDIHKDKINDNPPGNKEILLTGNGETLCYEIMSGRYFKSDIEKIRKAENDLNRALLNDLQISLNDVYYELGLGNTKMGEEVGWAASDGKIDFVFSSQLTPEGVPCLVVDYQFGPFFDYNRR